MMKADKTTIGSKLKQRIEQKSHHRDLAILAQLL